ncbi:MAG: hypothetical protein WA431_11420 [Candidatus Cybelea sp.]
MNESAGANVAPGRAINVGEYLDERLETKHATFGYRQLTLDLYLAASDASRPALSLFSLGAMPHRLQLVSQGGEADCDESVVWTIIVHHRLDYNCVCNNIDHAHEYWSRPDYRKANPKRYNADGRRDC